MLLTTKPGGFGGGSRNAGQSLVPWRKMGAMASSGGHSKLCMRCQFPYFQRMLTLYVTLPRKFGRLILNTGVPDREPESREHLRCPIYVRHLEESILPYSSDFIHEAVRLTPC